MKLNFQAGDLVIRSADEELPYRHPNGTVALLIKALDEQLCQVKTWKVLTGKQITCWNEENFRRVEEKREQNSV